MSLLGDIDYLQQKTKPQSHKFGISLLGDIDYLQWQQKLQFLYPVPSFLVYIWIV